MGFSGFWNFRTVKDGWPQFDVAGGWSGQDIVPCFIKILGCNAFRRHCRLNMRRGVLTVLSISKYMQDSGSLVGERMCYLGCVIHAYHPCQHISAVWNPLQNEGLFSQKFVAQRLPSTHFDRGSHLFCPNQSKSMQINKNWHPIQLLYKKDKDCSKFWATPWLEGPSVLKSCKNPQQQQLWAPCFADLRLPISLFSHFLCHLSPSKPQVRAIHLGKITVYWNRQLIF